MCVQSPLRSVCLGAHQCAGACIQVYVYLLVQLCAHRSISDCMCPLSLFCVDEIACMFSDVSVCAEMSRCLWAPRLPSHHTGRDTESERQTYCLLETRAWVYVAAW